MDTYKKTSTGWEVDNDGFNLLANNSKYLTKKFNIEEVQKEEVNEDGWSEVSTLPYNFWGGAAVVLDNEIHIMGSGAATTIHYKYNTSTNTWSNVSTLPWYFNGGSAVVLDNEIHLLGGDGIYHYKYSTDNKWYSVSKLPYNFYQGSAVVLDGEIHILGTSKSSYKRTHCKYNISTKTWSIVSTIPYGAFYGGSAVVLDNEIHIFSGNSGTDYRRHYKYNSSTNTWSSVSTLYNYFHNGCAVVYNDEIHLLGNDYSGYWTDHYKYNISTNKWSSVSTLPYNFYDGSAVVLNNEIHILGGGNSRSTYTSHYRYYINHYLKEVTPFKSRYIKTSNGWESIDTVEETYNKINEKIKELPMKIVKID